jgi:hypothetical protein
MIIKRLDLSDTGEVQRWDTFVRERGGLSQLSHWAGIIYSVYSFEPLYLFAEEMGEIVSIFPCFRVRNPLGKRELVSIPHLESGGMVNTGPFDLYLDYFFKNSAGNPLRISQSGEPLGEFSGNAKEVIMIKDLPQNGEEIINTIRSAAVRRTMRKSLELHFRMARGSDEDNIHAFYGLYLEKMREFGTPPHPFRFIKAIRDAFGERCRVLALKDSGGRFVGAGLYVGVGATLYNLFLAVPSRFLRQDAGHRLEYGVMEFAVEKGFTSLVLGRCERGSGNYQYKSRLGGNPAPLLLYRFEADKEGYREVAQRTAKEKYRSMARLWSRLPSMFTDHVGPLIRKWIY